MHGKRILVTGAAGFMGAHIARRLVAEGANVRGLIRRLPGRAVPGTEYCQGDVIDPNAAAAAVEGCEVIVHTAALRPSRPAPSWARFRAVNVRGVENLLRAFRPPKDGRFLLLSTINVHGLPPPHGANADSSLIRSCDRYSDTKLEGEQLARSLARTLGIPLTILRPACTFGPGSAAWTLQPFADIRRSSPVLIGSGRGLCNAIYIDNLVDLVIRALQTDAAAGEALIASDGIGIEWRQFFSHYARLAGRPLRSIPYPAARAAGIASGMFERVTGRPGPLPPSSFAFYTHRVVFDVQKNVQLLGHRPAISFEEGMRRSEAWLREEKLV